jgi:hypothetical protein
MKQIIDGKMYDTKKMTKIYSRGWLYRETIWKSDSGTYIILIENPLYGDTVRVISKRELADFLGVNAPEKYIELFGEAEEG